MSSKKWHNANIILDRIKEAYNMRSDVELARFLDRDATTISSWRKRNTIDWDLILAKCKDINRNYLIDGDTPIFSYDIKPSGLETKDAEESYRNLSPKQEEIKRDYEEQSIQLIQRIENLPWSKEAKIKLVDALIRIVESDYEDARREIRENIGRQQKD